MRKLMVLYTTTTITVQPCGNGVDSVHRKIAILRQGSMAFPALAPL